MHLPLSPLAGLTFPRAPTPPGRLRPLGDFGANPGTLKAWAYVPAEDKAAATRPLVVVLHGCTQDAAGYDRGSGWSALAEAYGFAVLYPEQQRANNANLCFNWFEPGDTRRGAGEAESIAQMIETMAERHGVDRERVFVTGLSAGGAMAAVMLALYPELFAGGAILAGLPHGAAASVQEAFQQMRAPSATGHSHGSAIRKAAKHAGAWPAISVWHGTADTVVSPSNADAIVRQWAEVHGIAGEPPSEDRVDGHRHRLWRDGKGRVVVEDYRVSGMGHGTPLATTGECGCGEAGAFMLEAGISSTVHSAKSWGILGRRREVAQPAKALVDSAVPKATAMPESATPAAKDRITQVIEDALRSAGLMS